MNSTDFLPMPDDMLPLFPRHGDTGPQVCSAVRFYLPILDDLAPEQAEVIRDHVQSCSACALEQQHVERANRLLASLPASEPSPRADQAIREAIAARVKQEGEQEHTPSFPVPLELSLGEKIPAKTESQMTTTMGKHSLRITGTKPSRSIPRGRPVLMRQVLSWGSLAAAAVLLFALLTTLHFWTGTPSTPQAFALPANLSWSGYVLYHSETRIAANGLRYRINSYHDLASGRMHVETLETGSLDVVAIGDSHTMLGLDMMHHVAQWGATAWAEYASDGMFDLAELRRELNTHAAVYLDTDRFGGQAVYRIRYTNGLVLLLDMHYMPVNVLSGAVGPGTGEPMYDTLKLESPAQVANGMWDMSVPTGFHMGTLPPKPVS